MGQCIVIVTPIMEPDRRQCDGVDTNKPRGACNLLFEGGFVVRVSLWKWTCREVSTIG